MYIFQFLYIIKTNVQSTKYVPPHQRQHQYKSTVVKQRKVRHMKEFEYTPQHPTYVKCFWNGNVFDFKNTDSFWVSGYKLPGLDSAMQYALKSDDVAKLYVVCPLYKNKFTDELADCQVSVTGTSYEKENSDDTFMREIGEEICLLITPETINRTSHYVVGQRRIQNYWLQIDSTTKMVKPSPKQINVKYPRDDKLFKIQGFVFGKLDDLEKVFNGELHPYLSKDSDPTQNDKTYLAGIRLVSLLDIVLIYNTFSKR